MTAPITVDQIEAAMLSCWGSSELVSLIVMEGDVVKYVISSSPDGTHARCTEFECSPAGWWSSRESYGKKSVVWGILPACCGALWIDDIQGTAPQAVAALAAAFNRSLLQGTLASYQDVNCLKPYKPFQKTKFSVFNVNSGNWLMSWAAWTGRILPRLNGLTFYYRRDGRNVNVRSDWVQWIPKLLSKGVAKYNRKGVK